MNNHLSNLIGAAVCAAFLLTSNPLAAADPAADPAAPHAAKKVSTHPYPFRGTVDSLDAAGKTIQLDGKKNDRTIHVTAESVLEKAGKPAKFEEIAPGDYAKGLVTRPDGSREVLVKGTFGPRPEKRPRTKREASANR